MADINAQTIIRERLARRNTPEEGRVIGDVVSWNQRAIDAPRAKVRQLIEDLGLADDIVLGDPPAVTSFRRAITNAGRGRDVREFVIEKLGENDEEIAYACARKEVADRIRDASDNFSGDLAAQKDLRFASEFVATFKRRVADSNPVALSGELLVIDPVDVRHVAADRLVSQFRALRDRYTPVDLSRAFVKCFDRKWGGIRLKLDGGMWFIPAEFGDMIARWRYFMVEVKGRPVVLPQLDTGDTKAGIAAAVEDDLMAQIEKTREEIRGMSGRTRGATMEALTEQHSRIKAKINMTTRLLGREMRGLEGLLADADAALTQQMNAKAESRAQKGDNDEG